MGDNRQLEEYLQIFYTKRFWASYYFQKDYPKRRNYVRNCVFFVYTIIMSFKKSYDVILLGSSLGVATILRELHARKIKNVLLVTNTNGFSAKLPYGEVVEWQELLPGLDVFVGSIEANDAEKSIISMREKVHHIKVNTTEEDSSLLKIAYKFLILDELPSKVYFPVANPKFLADAGKVRDFFRDIYSRMPDSPKSEGISFCVLGDTAGSGKLFFDLRDRVLEVAEKNGHPLKNITFIFVGERKFLTEGMFRQRATEASPIYYVAREDIKNISETELITKEKSHKLDVLLALGSEPVITTEKEQSIYGELISQETTYHIPRMQNSLETFRQANIIAEQVERLLWNLPEKKVNKDEVWGFIDTGRYTGVLMYRGKRVPGMLGLLLYRIFLFCSFFVYFSPKIARRLNRTQG